jgi:hypothetical protein
MGYKGRKISSIALKNCLVIFQEKKLLPLPEKLKEIRWLFAF